MTIFSPLRCEVPSPKESAAVASIGVPVAVAESASRGSIARLSVPCSALYAADSAGRESFHSFNSPGSKVFAVSLCEVRQCSTSKCQNKWRRTVVMKGASATPLESVSRAHTDGINSAMSSIAAVRTTCTLLLSASRTYKNRSVAGGSCNCIPLCLPSIGSACKPRPCRAYSKRKTCITGLA